MMNNLNIDDHTAYTRRRKIISLITIAMLIAIFIIMSVILWKPLMSSIKNPEQFRLWIDTKGMTGKLIFIGIDVLQMIFAAIPGGPLELGAGYAFGTIEGTILCLIAAIIGTTIIFIFSRILGIKLVEAFISREKIRSLSFIKNSRNLNLLIFALFFLPGTPKDFMTYFIGLTPMKLSTFLILSCIARIPSLLTATMAGNALGVKNYTAAIIVYITIGIISLIGILIYNKLSRRPQVVESQND